MSVNQGSGTAENVIEPAATQLIDENIELQEYLVKLIELVPHLQEENIKKISYSDKGANEQQTLQATYCQQLENLQNLDISSKSISDLQILQSVLDYIVYLQDKVCA